MTDPNLDFAPLYSRISALEKKIHHWKMGGLFLLIALVVAVSLTGYKAYAQHRMVRSFANAVAAKEFVLIGPKGRARGRIAVINGKPALQFYNSSGQLWWYAPPKMGVESVKQK